VRSQWRLKAILAAAMTVLFCGPYFLAGHYPLFPVRDLPLTWADRAVGFHPYAWVWVYQSEYLVVNLIPWLALTRCQLTHYARGFAVVALVSFVVFVFFPVRSPRPPMSDQTGMYRLVLQYDVPLNALPSLHAGLVVYTLCFGWRVFAGRLPRGLGAACVLWAGLILYATLATKQHYLVDIVAGAVLAVIADAVVWPRAPVATALAHEPLPAES
jgi:membrane-associated phospholipid phosphatase